MGHGRDYSECCKSYIVASQNRIRNVHGCALRIIVRQELFIHLIALHVCVCVCGGRGICTVVRYFCSFTIISAGQSKELDGSKMSCTSVGAHVEKEKAYSTWYSQAVSHPSTNQARPCLASEIRRDRACSGWYGRKHLLLPQNGLL